MLKFYALKIYRRKLKKNNTEEEFCKENGKKLEKRFKQPGPSSLHFSSYQEVNSLILDMRKILIKKYYISLQSQLYSAKQGHRPFENYGSELEQLFVNLTVS